MGHSLLPDWRSYARFLLPVIYQLTYSTMLMAFMTSLCLLASPLAQSLIILFTFMLSIFVVVSPPWPKSLWLWGVPRRHRFRLPWKRVKKFRRRKLPYWLVRRCRRRVGQRPPRLDGSYFPSSRRRKYRRRERREARARDRALLKLVERFMTPDRDYRFKLDDGVSDAGLDAF